MRECLLSMFKVLGSIPSITKKKKKSDLLVLTDITP
jgi:hypothetical protein